MLDKKCFLILRLRILIVVLKHIYNSGCRPQSSGFLTLVAAKPKVDSIMTFNKCYVQGVPNPSSSTL